MEENKGMVIERKEEERFGMKKLTIYVDGSGKGDYGFRVKETDYCKTFHEDGITSNEAEYKAILVALMAASKSEAKEIEILSDSKLAVKQLNHDWKIKELRLRELATQVWVVIAGLNKRVTIKWIPSEQNLADKLLP